jgi:hypothetical protein
MHVLYNIIMVHDEANKITFSELVQQYLSFMHATEMIPAALITSFNYGRLLDNTRTTIDPAANPKAIIGATNFFIQTGSKYHFNFFMISGINISAAPSKAIQYPK